MSCDCSAIAFDEVFGERTARHDVRRFLKRGLPRRARTLVSAIERATPLAGAETLEIGAGAGGLSITLLERGATRATVIDASPPFVAAATSLAQQRGLSAKLEAVAGDFAARPDAAPPADVVVLDRVICCYPDLEGLLHPAALRARRVVALSYPRDAWWARLLVRTTNAGLMLTRRRFRMRFHPPARVRKLLADAGFATAESSGHVAMWELLVVSRS